MSNYSDELLSRIIKVRRAHAAAAFVSLLAILLVIWFFQYSDIPVSYVLKIAFVIVALPTGYFIYSYANSSFKVNCPRCNEVVEQGRLPSDPIPPFCKKCGLSIHVK